jgi:hypothetical protein
MMASSVILIAAVATEIITGGVPIKREDAGSKGAWSRSAGTKLIHVKNASELTEKLAKARGGEHFLLDQGEYGTLRLVNAQYDSTVFIGSANREAKARFSDITMAGSRNITIEDVSIGRSLLPSQPIWTYISRLERNENIRLSRVSFHGSLDGDPTNDGNLVFIRDVRGLIVEDSEFQQANAALIVERSSEVLITRNYFHDQKLDAINMAAVQDVKIVHNFITGHYPTGPKDHPDAIQFWTHGTRQASERILIEGNVIWQGRGLGSQGIFLKDETGILPYRDITINNNMIYNTSGYWHGISLENADHVTITNNSALSSPADPIQNRLLLRKVRGARVNNNVFDQITLMETSEIRLQNNIDLTQRSAKRLIPALGKKSLTPRSIITQGYGVQETPDNARLLDLGQRFSAEIGQE